MDLSYTPEQEQFRAKVRKFLEDNLPKGWGQPGFRPDGMSMNEFMPGPSSGLLDAAPPR